MKKFKLLIIITVVLVTLGIITVFGINQYVKVVANKNIAEDVQSVKKVDAILVLGCQVREDGSLSLMLQDRIDKAIELYEAGVSDKIIVSGDHGREEYDEVNAMKNYLIEKGIPSENIFMDHAGFSTYESLYRAQYIFKVEKVLVVTQEYHLYRAVYIGNKLGIETYGVPAAKILYYGQTSREIREILARNKDFVKCIFKFEPTYLGESIPVSGNGDLTND